MPTAWPNYLEGFEDKELDSQTRSEDNGIAAWLIRLSAQDVTTYQFSSAWVRVGC